MPGILPMKVIKVGSSSQSRIAQACDRCRSKKIRCDGIRPCCTQCANVGFECKTSDKLSRRAFPRGYTESLEERVRALEAEVRELKDLLDEKDEKIDMLSKMHSHKSRSSSTQSSSKPSPAEANAEPASGPAKEDVFRVQASPLLLGSENADAYFMGASSGRAFIDAFKRRVQESGKSLSGFNTDAFLSIQGETSPPVTLKQRLNKPSAPPRIFSDRCINIYFQEWSPLFPVLHKPTFLRLYEEYISHPDGITDSHKLAQLHLVFAIAGISCDLPDREQIALCEAQWRSSLDAILMENTLATLQCLILSLIYCISKADYSRFQHYKGIAVGLSHRLGLHQNQKRFSFGALTIETRKKVFWTLYTVDCFSAALLGLPKLLKEEDIHCEYPADTDDEYVTERGFQPTLPGESTKISNALALFRAARILSKVLDKNYPSATTHDLSLQSLSSLDEELSDWSEKLPQHLKLTFVQDKPSTDITGSRSALLSLAFYYIRTLIYRPAVGSTLGSKSSPSVISLADSSKHIIQIVQLLEERNMSFSFCLNKNEMLTLCGLSILYQGLDLKQEGKLMQDGQRMVMIVAKYLEKANAPGAMDFRRLVASLTNIESQPRISNCRIGEGQMKTVSTVKSSSTSPPIARKHIPSQVYRHPSASISESDLLSQQEKLRRATHHNNPVHKDGFSRQGRLSLEASRSESPRFKHRTSSVTYPSTMGKPQINKVTNPPNLDYLSLSNTPISSQPTSPAQPRIQNPSSHSSQTSPPTTYTSHKASASAPSEWEVLLGSFDDRHLYDAIYGGSNNGPITTTLLPDTASSNVGSWSPDSWDYTLGMGENGNNPGPNSVLSFSEESLSSGDDLSASELMLGSGQYDSKPALVTSNAGNNDFDFLLYGLNNGLGI